MSWLKTFFKEKTTIIAIAVAFIYPLIMMGIFLPAYSAMPKNLPDLKVAIVNEDQKQGTEIVKQMKENLPFKMDTDMTLSEAREALDDREIYLVIHIPEDFTANLTDAEKQVTMNFETNSGNTALVSSAMTMVVDEMANTFDAQLESQMMQQMLVNLKVPEDQAAEMTTMVQDKFQANIVKTNVPEDGMHNQLGPTFLTIACNVAALVVSLILVKSLDKLRPVLGKWKSFIAMQLALLIIAITSPLPGLGVFFGLENYGSEVFLEMWLNHGLLVLAGCEIFLIFTMLFGQVGMLFNLSFLLAQVISGTGVLPKDILYGFYAKLSAISPVYYGVQADYTSLFGGGELAPYIGGQLILIACGFVITLIIQAIKPQDTPIKQSLI